MYKHLVQMFGINIVIVFFSLRTSIILDVIFQFLEEAETMRNLSHQRIIHVIGK